MKLTIATIALSVSAASAYNVGGFDTFGRPYFVSPRRARFGRRYGGPRCAPQGNGRDCVDRAFEDLTNEMKNDRARRRQGPSRRQGPNIDFKIDEDSIRQQEELISRAFGLASDVAKGFASNPNEAKEADEALRQQKEWVDRMFGFARDVSSGGEYSSVRSEVLQDDDTVFQIALDVPGVKTSDIDVTVEGTKDKVLVVCGKRNVGKDENGEVRTRKFSKVLALDPRSDTDQMSADLENGVLVLTVPRVPIENTRSVQKVSVNNVPDDATPSSDEEGVFPFELELDLPGVKASNIDITIEGDTDKTLVVTAIRELGLDSEGKPKTKEIFKSFKVDELVDTGNVVANLSNGVLKVSAPADVKKTEEAVRKIVVKEASGQSNDVIQSEDAEEVPDTTENKEEDNGMDDAEN